MNITPDLNVADMCVKRLRRRDGVERTPTCIAFSADAMTRMRFEALRRGVSIAMVMEELVLAHLPPASEATTKAA